jgi:hypothetical protein
MRDMGAALPCVTAHGLFFTQAEVCVRLHAAAAGICHKICGTNRWPAGASPGTSNRTAVRPSNSLEAHPRLQRYTSLAPPTGASEQPHPVTQPQTHGHLHEQGRLQQTQPLANLSRTASTRPTGSPCCPQQTARSQPLYRSQSCLTSRTCITCAAPASQAPIEATPGPLSRCPHCHRIHTLLSLGHVPFSRVPGPATAARGTQACGRQQPQRLLSAPRQAAPRSCPMRRAAAQRAPGPRRALSLLIPPLRLPSAVSRVGSAAARAALPAATRPWLPPSWRRLVWSEPS